MTGRRASEAGKAEQGGEGGEGGVAVRLSALSGSRTAGQLAVIYIGLALVTVAVCALGLAVGDADLAQASSPGFILELRGSRVGSGLLAGAALAVGGVLVQGLFRNPLASPSILGTTAGATLGGQLVMLALSGGATGTMTAALTRHVADEMALALGSIAGALAALALLMMIAGRRRDLVVLLLCGFILSSLFLSLGSFVLALSQDSWSLGRAVVAFSLGSISASGVTHVVIATPLVVAGTAAAWLWSRPLDLLLSGHDEAASLGVDVDAVRRWAVVWTALLTAAAVAVGGNVAFVGLVIPHALRPLVGVEHRRLVPAAALAGGGFVVACDVVSRLPARDMPLGVVTGLVGAPVFIALLVRARREGVYG